MDIPHKAFDVVNYDMLLKYLKNYDGGSGQGEITLHSWYATKFSTETLLFILFFNDFSKLTNEHKITMLPDDYQLLVQCLSSTNFLGLHIDKIVLVGKRILGKYVRRFQQSVLHYIDYDGCA